jgi:hypothetical protein
MKRIARTILGCVCFASIILAGAENPDGSCNILWTLSFLAVAVLSGLGWKKIEEAK